MKEKTVKRSTTAGCSRETELSPLQASATEDEIFVAGILLNLKTMMSLTEGLAKFNWQCKRRRSCLPPIPGAASLPSKSVQRTENKIEEVAVVAEKKDDDGAAQPISSPDTPFTFSPSEESDEKSSKKTSKKRSREYYLDMIERQTENRDSLRGEMQNVNKYYENLKSYNSKLKATLQEAQRKVESQKEITGNHCINTSPYQQQLIAQVFDYSVDPITGSNGSVNRVGLIGFDLNVPAEEEFQPLDVSSTVADKRATFAEARRRRRGMMKMKIKSGRNGV